MVSRRSRFAFESRSLCRTLMANLLRTILRFNLVNHKHHGVDVSKYSSDE